MAKMVENTYSLYLSWTLEMGHLAGFPEYSPHHPEKNSKSLGCTAFIEFKGQRHTVLLQLRTQL